jgi:hypothetical protein
MALSAISLVVMLSETKDLLLRRSKAEFFVAEFTLIKDEGIPQRRDSTGQPQI